MGLVAFPGTSRMYYPFDLRIARQNDSPPQAILDSGVSQIAIGGRVWIKERRNILEGDPFQNPYYKYVTRVGFPLGSVVKSGGSSLRVGLANISLSSAPVEPGIPQPQTVSETATITNGNSSFVSNTWLRTPLFDTYRAVRHGDRLAVVIEWNGTRLGSDSVGIQMRSTIQETIDAAWVSSHFPFGWQAESAWPIVVLELSDNSDGSGPASYGILEGAVPSSGEGLLSFNSSSSPDEHGLRFRPPWNCIVDGAVVFGDLANTSVAPANFDIVLYEGSVAIATLVMDGNEVSQDRDIKEFQFANPITLSGGSDYTIAVKATSANNNNLLYDSINQFGYVELVGDSNLAHIARTDGGAFAVQSFVNLPMMGVRIIGLEDGT